MGCNETDVQHEARLMKFEVFRQFLQENHVPVDKYGTNKAKTVRDLWVDVVLGGSQLQSCSFIPTIQEVSPTLCLQTSLVLLELRVNFGGSDKFLLLRDELPGSSNHSVARHELHAPVTTNMFSDETPFDALCRLCVQRLGLADEVCRQQFFVETRSFTETVQESSVTFPGLMTMNKIHTLAVRIQDKFAPGIAGIGLPQGDEFDASFCCWMHDVCTNYYMWVSREEYDQSVLRWYGEKQPQGSEHVKCKFVTRSGARKPNSFWSSRIVQFCQKT